MVIDCDSLCPGCSKQHIMGRVAAPQTAPNVTKKVKSTQGVGANAGRESDLARARLASLDRSSADAILSQNLNGIILSWNKGAERMFGHSARAIRS